MGCSHETRTKAHWVQNSSFFTGFVQVGNNWESLKEMNRGFQGPGKFGKKEHFTEP